MQDNLNRKYEFSLDMKKLDTQFQTGSKFSTQDVKTSEMYIQLTQNNLPMNLENSTVYANIDKPSGAKVLHQCEILDENKGIVKVDLSVQSICEAGVYKFEIVAINENEKIVSPIMTYESYKSLGDNELVESSNEFNALDKALSEVKQIDVKFNNVNNKIDSEIEKVNVQLDTKANKIETANIQQQVNNLVLGAVGDGNNAEVIQARGKEDVINDRLSKIENGNVNNLSFLKFNKTDVDIIDYKTALYNKKINGYDTSTFLPSYGDNEGSIVIILPITLYSGTIKIPKYNANGQAMLLSASGKVFKNFLQVQIRL